MVFTTFSFILFFAVVFFGYYALPSQFRWYGLLAASWFFYGFAAPYFLIYLGVTTIVTYLGARCLATHLDRQRAWIAEQGKRISRDEKRAYKERMERQRRGMVAAVVIILVGMLVAFKYLGFFFKNIMWFGALVGCPVTLPEIHWILPIGLSFYVFQSLGYCIDVAREQVVAERNFFKHALFVSYFPQILQGPIGDYSRLSPQFFEKHIFDYEQAVFGLQRIVWGFFKKLCIANMIALRINPVWSQCSDYSGLIFWLTILFLYSIQLYADFSGYMDIACGCSQMLGIRLDENFQSPYLAKSIAEFWRKWHISLGVWFKNYVFYPLLRSEILTNLRKRLNGHDHMANAVPTVCALFIVWLLIGLWHGADWSYVIYGLYHGSFVMSAIMLEPVTGRFHSTFPRITGGRIYGVFQIVRTFILVTLGYVIFKPADLSSTFTIIVQSFQSFGLNTLDTFVRPHLSRYTFIAFVTLLLFAVDWIHLKKGKGWIRQSLRRFPKFVRWGGYLLVTWVITFLGLYGAGLNTFEYFRF